MPRWWWSRRPTPANRSSRSGRIDVFMTDYPYSRRCLLDSADWARLLSPPQPLHVLPYAYALRQGDAALAGPGGPVRRTLIRQDGRLAAAAQSARPVEIVQRTGNEP